MFILLLFRLFSHSVFPTHKHTHTHALHGKFDMIFHSGRQLSLMWSWAPEFLSNEFFYYASLLQPLQGYSLTALWSCVNTKPPTSVCVCARTREREWGLLHPTCYCSTNNLFSGTLTLCWVLLLLSTPMEKLCHFSTKSYTSSAGLCHI